MNEDIKEVESIAKKVVNDIKRLLVEKGMGIAELSKRSKIKRPRLRSILKEEVFDITMEEITGLYFSFGLQVSMDIELPFKKDEDYSYAC